MSTTKSASGFHHLLCQYRRGFNSLFLKIKNLYGGIRGVKVVYSVDFILMKNIRFFNKIWLAKTKKRARIIVSSKIMVFWLSLKLKLSCSFFQKPQMDHTC